jgi:hypothetical protein
MGTGIVCSWTGQTGEMEFGLLGRDRFKNGNGKPIYIKKIV